MPCFIFKRGSQKVQERYTDKYIKNDRKYEGDTFFSV